MVASAISFEDEFFDFGTMPDPGSHGGTATHRCDLACITVVDYLMKFTYSRRVENWLKQKKWTNYDQKVRHLVNCMGDILADDCREYRLTGCTQLGETNGVSLGELLWCREFY